MSKLVHSHSARGDYQISWSCDGDVDAAIGENWHINHLVSEPNRLLDPDAWESWTAEHAAAPWADRKDCTGFTFSSMPQARRAMVAIKAALSAKRPLHEWERTALNAGWRPPAGWDGKQ